MAKTQQGLIEELEPLVDASSLSDVILALARVCDEKSEHLLVNWQDKATAKAWDRAARVLDGVSEKVGDL
jgi:hypothetical protein